MSPAMPPRAARPARWAGICSCLVATAAGHGCAPTDRVARQDVETLQTNVQQMESSIQARQAGVYEQIRDLREEQNRLARLIEENARQAKTVGQQLEQFRERTREDLENRDRLDRASSQASGEQVARLGGRIDGLQKDLQKGFETIDTNYKNLLAFEKEQEQRIARLPEQFQNQLKVVVDEVGKANQALSQTVTALRADLDAARQEAAVTRQGLVDLQGAMVQIAERLAAAQTQIQDLTAQREAGRQAAREAARKPAAARGGQHTIRPGETLTAIATRYGISVKSLMDANRITDPDSIREGQKLTIPEP